MRKYFFTIIHLGAILFFVSCSTDTGTSPNINSGGTSAVKATFSSIQQNVFSKSCAFSSCHAGSVSPTLSAGNAYGNIVNRSSSVGKAYIKPSDPDNSYLLLKLKGQNISGARMPRNASPLTQAVIDSISLWIQNGAQNN